MSNWLTSLPIAHRGLHGDDILENTSKAFENAIRHGYAIEMDVQKIKDGLVVFHDETLDRLSETNGSLSEMTLSEIKKIKLHDGSTILSFDEFLETVNGKTPILIEIKKDIKTKDYELESAVLDRLKRYRGEFAVQSFNPATVFFYKEHAPHIIRGQLSCTHEEIEDSFTKAALSTMVFNEITKPHFISYDIDALCHDLYEKYRANSIAVLTWTVKTKQHVETAKKYSDNIIFETIDPALFRS